MNYRGRFAPSPTGPLHAGSLVAALASWLDARVHGGIWLLRIEDVDSTRCKPQWAQEQLQQLAAHGLHSDEPVLWQSTRSAAYAAALDALQAQGLVYACHCSRKKISDYWLAQGVDKARHGDLVYPGFCRDLALPMRDGVALRLDVGKAQAQLFRHSRESGNPPSENPSAQPQSLGGSGGDASLRWHDGTGAFAEAARPAEPSPPPLSLGERGETGIPASEEMSMPHSQKLRHSRESGNPPSESPSAQPQNPGGSGGDASLRWHDGTGISHSLPHWGRARVGAEGQVEANFIWAETEAKNSAPAELIWIDRQLGQQSQNIPRAVGDFVLRRADACWSYQLAVVLDDAQQGISHVVRGLDLLDNTPRQILLQMVLGLPTPQYLHTPLVLAADGQKLSKQNAATALDSSSPAQCLANLQAAAQALGLPAPSFGPHTPLADYLRSLLPLWACRYGGQGVSG